MKFDEILKCAESEWKLLQSSNKPLIFVGAGTCGKAAGANDILESIKETLAHNKIEAIIIDVGCLGLCYAEPMIGITKPGKSQVIYANLTGEVTAQIIKDYLANDNPRPDLSFGYIGDNDFKDIPNILELPVFKPQIRLVLRNCGLIDPQNINHYIANGGYSGLEKALKMSPEGIIDEIRKSGLRGRGGAGFSTAQKWEFCRLAPGDEKFIICNADEGDPGAFMNRSLMEGDPHSLLEGMVIGAYAIGATQGYIYCRAEYPLALERLRIALRQMEEYGLIGDNILGSRFNFHLKIKEGAGAFVCGEETALMASIEGNRGMPRSRPPFPAISGLWGKPTNINNVETWVNAALIMQKGSGWYAQYGSSKSKGTKTFALVGKVKRTGLIEVPLGITLREIIYDIGGGIFRDKNYKAVQTGGPSGGCLPSSLLDLPVDYESLTAAGSIMGSGGMIVADENTCMVDLTKYFLSFTQSESCGKCTPCRVGTGQMLKILERITQGKGLPEDIEKLEKIAGTVKKGSLCGLGQNAPNPVLTTLRYFRDEYLEHIMSARCRAASCKELVVAPCSHTCPAGINVPKYIAHVAEGDYLGAIETIRERNPFAAVCGRICHHPCERKCRRGELDDPIAIRALKRSATEWYFKHANKLAAPKPFPRTKPQKVAIIGAGPAGLSCGYFLSKLGYGTTVFEASSRGGGMLSEALPEFRLPQSVVEQDIDYITKCGVEIKYNMRLGTEITLENLKRDGYSAVFIAAGAPKSLQLGITGEAENIRELYYGLAFLIDVKKGTHIKIGAKVAVIGGGNVALDASRTSLRLGASEVNIYYRRSREEMPVTEAEYKEAEVEGIKINFLVNPTKILSDSGKVTGLECVRMKLGDIDASGRRRSVPVPGSEFSIAANTVIAAVGQAVDLSFLSQDSSFQQTRAQRLSVNEFTLSTSVPGIFSGGDFITGPGMVIDAIAAGRRAAQAIDNYITGSTRRILLHDIRSELTLPTGEKAPTEVQEPQAQQNMPELPIKKRKNSFREIELGYSNIQSEIEAKRCLRCDLEER